MKPVLVRLAFLFAAALSTAASAQLAVVAQPNHELLLASSDAHLAANKRLVYDFWREVFEGGHMELADKYMAESYIQHNPNVATGRAAFIEAFSKRVKPQAIEAKVKAPIVAIVAEGDLVVFGFVQDRRALGFGAQILNRGPARRGQNRHRDDPLLRWTGAAEACIKVDSLNPMGEHHG